MKNSVFCKTMKNAQKHWEIELITTEKRRKYLVTEPSYHTTKFFVENLLPIEMKKKKQLK